MVVVVTRGSRDSDGGVFRHVITRALIDEWTGVDSGQVSGKDGGTPFGATPQLYLAKTEIGIHTLGCRNQKLVVDIKIRAIDRVCTQFVSGPSSFVVLRGQVHPCRRNDVEGLKLETLGTALFRQHISDHDLVLVDLNGIRELPS